MTGVVGAERSLKGGHAFVAHPLIVRWQEGGVKVSKGDTGEEPKSEAKSESESLVPIVLLALACIAFNVPMRTLQVTDIILRYRTHSLLRIWTMNKPHLTTNLSQVSQIKLLMTYICL